MRITSKGQVTIPARIRKEAGFLPNTDVEFVPVGRGEVRLVKATKTSARKSRGELLVEHMRGRGTGKMTTDEIMALMRGD
ncbi:MAG TPA: AbrB/MazE/SpoVT family DNA-binding domain-containing protein [Rhizomicrobium sp.]|jgi:AbrB family looped-hinge helix DNA binding protein|nr:AbrB/MazE/SpoVT family DNA-binding domain-containing protein [Rhizomicrobium sp.]